MTASAAPWWSTRAFGLAMIVAAAVPLLWPAIPPLVDVPGHIGRYAVELAPAGSPLHRWYRFEWAMIGNLGIDLLVIPLSRLFGLELAVKLIVLAIPPLTVAGMLATARAAHGEVPPTAALALPLAYGYPFQFGFVNFALSMALALLAFAFWLRLGVRGRVRLRALVFVPAGMALWLVHSFGWGVLGLAAYFAEMMRARQAGAGWPAAIRAAMLAVLPLTPPFALMLLWRSGAVGGTTGDWFNWFVKNFYLQNMLRNEGNLFDLLSGLSLVFVALCGLAGVGFRRNPILFAPALALIATYVLLPRVALGSAYADMRLAPFMVAFLLLALAPRTLDPRWRNAIALAATAFFLVRMGVQTLSFVKLDRGYKAQLAALDHLPRGVRVFALAKLDCLSAPHGSRLDHIDGLAMARREAFANGQWAVAGAQLLKVDRPDAKGFAEDPSQLVRPPHCNQPASHDYPAVLRQFPRAAFDYLWLIDFPADIRPRGDSGLVPVWQSSAGALYRIRRTPSAD